MKRLETVKDTQRNEPRTYTAADLLKMAENISAAERKILDRPSCSTLLKAVQWTALNKQSEYNQDIFWQYIEHLIREVQEEGLTREEALEKIRLVQQHLHDQKGSGYMKPWPDTVEPAPPTDPT